MGNFFFQAIDGCRVNFHGLGPVQDFMVPRLGRSLLYTSLTKHVIPGLPESRLHGCI
jgi:hypothetical protein